MNEAIILVGGLGTRLKSIVPNLPKPMAEVNGKPFLEYILNFLDKNDIKRVVLSAGYKWEIINDYFGNNFKGIELCYSVENSPLGTGGAIKKALTYINSENVYILNGDTFFDIDLSSLDLIYNSKLILSLKFLENFDRYSCVEYNNNNQVESFSEKRFRARGAINGGIYLVKSNIFENFKFEEKFSFENFIKKNFKTLNASVSVFDRFFIDIGIPEDYNRAQKDMANFL